MTWLHCAHPRPEAGLRLFCFPHAGGGLPAFRGWGTQLPASIELWTVQLPGRGSNKGAPFTQMPALINALLPVIKPYLDKPFAFFGHSLGGLIAFELAQAIEQQGDNGAKLQKLIIAACAAPHLPRQREPIHHLPPAEFIRCVHEYGGVDEAVWAHEELVSFIMPALRADFALFDTYQYEEKEALNAGIIAFGGLDDPFLSIDQVQAWQRHTTTKFIWQQFPGNHFFHQTSQAKLLHQLTLALTIPV